MKGLTIAVNTSKIANRPESFDLMHKVGPKVCIATASHPGFVGFMALLQTGVHDMAGRYGGAALDMRETLNPLAMFQYTIWKDVKSHEEMHYQQFNTIYELCHHCLSMVVEGPWEPYYEVVAADLSGAPHTPQTRIVLGDHWIMEGHEQAFEAGVQEALTWLKEKAQGLTGWMLMKQIGASAVGSFQLDPEGMLKPTLGANPPAYNTNYGDKPLEHPPIPPQKPAQYFVHMEWAGPEQAHLGLAKTMVNYELRQIHNRGVLAHVCRGPYFYLTQPMHEETAMVFP
ncbi:MAG: sulfur oxygenase reductase family protein [Deltaproteobacteria bacterium]|nr:sulfur oxygenase reductase family protein [Desulfitobacteriaceae bacterium]MDI6854611.1 sulfur oxygenase reductase family protein [Deltaproteobacteria bacterium]